MNTHLCCVALRCWSASSNIFTINQQFRRKKWNPYLLQAKFSKTKQANNASLFNDLLFFFCLSKSSSALKPHQNLVLKIRTTIKSFFTLSYLIPSTSKKGSVFLSGCISSAIGPKYKCPFVCLLTPRSSPHAFGDKKLPRLALRQSRNLLSGGQTVNRHIDLMIPTWTWSKSYIKYFQFADRDKAGCLKT